MKLAAARLAVVFAVFLAIAEVVRNWGDWGYWAFWVVDYIAVALLLAGARAALRPAGRTDVLAGGWGFTCAMFYMSFFSHLESLGRGEGDHGPIEHGGLTFAIGFLFAVTVVGFALSLAPRRAER